MSTIRQIQAIAGHVQLLMDNGFDHMPKWLPSSSGKLWTVSKGRPYYVSEWITGRGLLEPNDYEMLGKVMATLHQTTNHPPKLTESDGHTLKQLQLWKGLDKQFSKDKNGAARTNAKFRKWFRQYADDCKLRCDRSWDEMNDPDIAGLLDTENVRPALIHGDITYPNVIISEAGRLYIIDWDRARIGSIYIELAKTLMNTTGNNPEFIQPLLKGYEEIKPLSQAERKLIAALFRFPLEAWRAARFHNRKTGIELIGIMERSWPLRLQAINFMDEWANP